MLDGRNRWRTPLSVVFALLLSVAGMLLCCPPSLFHSRFPGRGYLMERPRYQIAVSSSAGRLAASIKNEGKINVYAEDHGKLIPVTSGTMDADPAWDPTGKRIAYVSLGQHGRLTLRVRSLMDGSDSKLLEETLISQPRWSRDGRAIFFLRSDPDVTDRSSIHAVDLQTKCSSLLVETPFNRTQAWDLLKEDQIAYVYDGAVWIKPPEGQPLRLPHTFSNPCMVSASPDNKLLLVCDSLAANDKLAVLVDLQSRRTKQIYRGYIRYMLWSPSGRCIAIASHTGTKVFRARGAASVTGDWEGIPAVEGIAVCWRADTRLVLIRPNKGNPYYLEDMDVESGRSTRLAMEAVRP